MDQPNPIFIRALSLDGADKRPSFACSALRELYLADCFPTVEFLENCTQLRVLELHIPAAVTVYDVLRILRRNPRLRTVKLWMQFNGSSWHSYADTGSHGDGDDRDELADNHGDPGGDTTLLGDVQHFSIGIASMAGRDYAHLTSGHETSLHQAIRFFTSRVNIERIPAVEVFTVTPIISRPEVSAGWASERDANIFGNDLIAHLHDVTSVELSGYTPRKPMLLRFEDARGFVRTISPPIRARPLEIALPFLARLRVLRMGVKPWVALAEKHADVTELPSLEELGLRGPLAYFARMPRTGVAVPRLRQLSLLIKRRRRETYGWDSPPERWQSQSQSDLAHDQSVDGLISTGKTVALDRLSGCPQPLPVLELVYEADEHFELEERIINCRPPEPMSVCLTQMPAREPQTQDLSDSESESNPYVHFGHWNSDNGIPLTPEPYDYDFQFGSWD